MKIFALGRLKSIIRLSIHEFVAASRTLKLVQPEGELARTSFRVSACGCVEYYRSDRMQSKTSEVQIYDLELRSDCRFSICLDIGIEKWKLLIF
jgi:hypothetical protein